MGGLLNPFWFGGGGGGGGGYVPTDTANMALWLDGLVSATGAAWNDQSGNGNHATQVTGANQPTVSSGAVIFDGTNDSYTLGSTITVPDDGFTTYVVADRNGTGDRCFCSGTPSAAYELRLSGDHRVTLLRSHNTDTGSSTSIVPDAKRLITVVSTINLRSFFVNTVADGTNATTVSSWGGINRIGCGYDGANNTDFFNGSIYEILMYTDAHDTTTRDTVEAYLMTKHGL